MSLTIGKALQRAQTRLTALPQAEPALEAAVLLSHVLGRPRTYLIAWPERTLAEGQRRVFETLVQRRCAGEPMAYVTARRDFWSLALEVNPHTLIPRPETELLVERALALIPPTAHWRIADLGTGSGAVAAALARERPRVHVLATDLSAAALAVARRNFRRIGVRNLEVRLGSWWDALGPRERLDLVVSNPPYIAARDSHLRRGDLPREPRRALIAGPDGREALRDIAARARRHLKRGGWLLLEHGHRQGPGARALLKAHGCVAVETFRDAGGHERVTQGRCGP